MKTGFGVLGRHSLGHALELESMGEDQVVALRGVGTERLLLLRWCARFDVRDGNPERIPDLEESLVGACVPRGVGYGARSDEGDPHPRLASFLPQATSDSITTIAKHHLRIVASFGRFAGCQAGSAIAGSWILTSPLTLPPSITAIRGV